MEEETRQEGVEPRTTDAKKSPTKKVLIISGVVLFLIAGGVGVYYLLQPDLSGKIVLPYIAHQRPEIDPHLPGTNALSDKLDEVLFDGLFNLTAGPSGVVYQDGLGEFIGIDNRNIVSIRLRNAKRWHDSWQIVAEDDEFTVTRANDHLFSAADLNLTLRRIQGLGSLSPDFILVSQALPSMRFDGPDAQNVIRLQFRGDRIWTEADIKEVLSFKVLPDNSPLNALNYRVGTAAYMSLPPRDGVSNYRKNPDSFAEMESIHLKPFIDNSTFATELSNGSINVVLETPFGSLSPILSDSTQYFYKSNISNTFFALLLNVDRLNRDQRKQFRNLIDRKRIVDRFFKVGTPQARHIADYVGNRDNYQDYVNYSVFPSSSYYVEDEIVVPQEQNNPPDLSILPDTLRVVACTNYGFREEYSELITILKDPSVTRGRVRVLAVPNEALKNGNYDAVLVAITGYRSNFLFDLYNIFLREPDLATYRINLVTSPDESGNLSVDAASFRADRNFFRLAGNGREEDDIGQFLKYLYGFMSTRQIGDKQEYAWRIDELEREMCLGIWLFSLPSLAHFRAQFDEGSIDLYGTASQLSTISKWRERRDR